MKNLKAHLFQVMSPPPENYIVALTIVENGMPYQLRSDLLTKEAAESVARNINSRKQ